MENSAQIILDWLNKDLSFNPEIVDIKKSFSNGFLFGKIFFNLNLITQDEFNEFIDSKIKSDINSNFSLVEKYCKKLFNFIIFEKEISQIKKEHLTSACLLLYKIRNGFFKIKINFNNIEFFGGNYSHDEISEQIKDLIEKQLGKNSEENDKEKNNKNIMEKNNKINMLDNNNIKELDEENTEINKASRFSQFLPAISAKRIFNKFDFKQSIFNSNIISTNKLSKSKSILLPLNNLSLKKKSNSTENIFIKKCEKNIFNTLNMEKNFQSRYDNISNKLIDVTFFNKKLEELGITKNNFKIKEKKSNEVNFNSTNSAILKSAEEISDELRNNIRKIKGRKEIKNFKINNDEKKINFFKMNKNFFDMNKKELFINTTKSNTNSSRRINYSKELMKNNQLKIIETKSMNSMNNQITFFPNEQKILPNLYSNTNIETINTTKRPNMHIFPKRNSIKEFDSKIFFKNLSYYTYTSFKNSCLKKYSKKKKISNKIREIILYIIDMTFEGYLYQNKHKTEIIDMDTFLKFYIYFLKNKPLRKKYIPIELANYKRSGKIDLKYDKENIYNNLTNDEKNSIEDFIYYLGVWNDDKIFKKNTRGIRLNYKYITNKNNIKENNNNNYFGIIEYEPTALENEDLTIPESIPDNYNLGNLLQEIFYNQLNINNKANDLIKNHPNGKWDYIPYKISLMGYPLSGRKTLAKKIINIYPNIKMYSMRRIINYYFDLYLQLVNPEEIPEEKIPKKKQGKNDKENNKIPDKENESVFEKFERQQKFKELKPIFDSMKSFIDYKLKGKNIQNPYVLSDESLCRILINKVEEDFPPSTQNKINKIILERQKSIKEIENQIEFLKKKKEEAKKPGINYDAQIEKYENDIKYIKIKSITGFILVDFPTNLTQCLLLENYLTNFIEEKRQKINDKEKIFNSTNSIIDYKYPPKEKSMNKLSGLNFIINIITKESIINKRFTTAKFDPLEKILYTGENTVIDDKNIKERLVDKIPYLPQELFEYYKDEYNNNINKIINLYAEFGFLSKKIYPENYDFLHPNKKSMIKSFYSIEADDIKDFHNLNKINITKDKKKKNEKENDEEENNGENAIVKDKVFNFICNILIEKLKKENEKYEEEQYNRENSKNNNKENKVKNLPELDSELNINKIRTKYKGKSPTKNNIGNLKLIDNNQSKIEIIKNEFCSMNKKYVENIGIFIHLTNTQKKDIYERLNLIQNKFRDYINNKNPDKRLIISNYIKKYNNLYNINPEYLHNEIVITQLNSDIEEIRTEIWNIISQKRENSINELNQIKHSCFFEVEFIKFYHNIKELLLNETEKFLRIFNSMLILYKKKKVNENTDINLLFDEYKKNLVTNSSIILKDIKDIEYHYTPQGDVRLDISLNELVNIILKNLETIFKNSIKMLFLYHSQISNIFGKVRKLIIANLSVGKKSRRTKKQRRKYSETKTQSFTMMNDIISNKENEIGISQEKEIKKIFLDEKNKYKYRICFIKNFAEKYIQIMKCTAENIFENLDDWIVTNVTLQSESLSYLINILKNFLFKEKKFINQEKDIDNIELDEFEKIVDIDDNKKFNENKSSFSNNSNDIDIKLKPFDNSSIIFNRIYHKINLNYLIEDNFIDTKIEEIHEKSNKKKRSEIKIKIIPPQPINNESNIDSNLCNNSSTEINADKSTMLNNKINKTKIMNDSEFYFDVEKFKFLYKLIKKYEVEDGYINKDIFFSIFIRQYLISKNNYSTKKRKNSDDSEESYNQNVNININYFYNEEINIKLNENMFHNNINQFPIICKALKQLNMKQIKRIYYCFGINIKKLNYIQRQNPSQEDKKEKEKSKEKINVNENQNEKKEKKEKRKSIIKSIKRKSKANNQLTNLKLQTTKSKDSKDIQSPKEETQKNPINDDLNKSENLEYNTYLNTKEIFTILPLIGVNILTPEEEDKIEKDLKNKLIKEKYLTKKDFFDYKFWFESFFDFYITNKLEDEANENSGITIIKEFLFDLWINNENSTYFNFRKFFDSLKVNKYITDFTDFNEVRYYDIIFS